MDIRGMKLLDELLGPPVCLFFYIFNSLRRPFVRRGLEPDKVNNILLIKFLGMGSIMLAGPMMRALKQRFHNSRIIILTFSDNRQICARIGLIDEVICVDTGSLFRFLLSLFAAISTIRKRRCLISVDLEFFSKSSTLIQYLCGGRIRVGYYLIQIGVLIRMLWRGDLLTHQVYYNPHKHTIEAFLALARAIGADTSDLALADVRIFDRDRQDAARILGESNIGPADYLIAFNINAGPLCPERRWPAENFAYLINKLRGRARVKIVLIGGASDSGYTRTFLASLGPTENLTDLTAKLGIGGLAAFLERADLLVTNDSGPMHLAASFSRPVIALFGPETPARFGPLGKGHTVFYPDIYCSPCLNVYNQKTAPCGGDNRCMRMIPPEDVYSAIKERYLAAMAEKNDS